MKQDSQREKPAIAGVDALIQLVRESSLRSLQQHAKDPAVSIVDQVSRPGPVYGHWLVIILVVSNFSRMTFKAFYMPQVSKKLAAKSLRRSPELLNERLGSDFMREFCNMSAGSIKSSLANLGIQIGLSLPLVSRGFDEAFAVRNKNDDTFTTVWTLKTDVGEVICSATIDVLDGKEMASIAWEQTLKAEEQEMEFL